MRGAAPSLLWWWRVAPVAVVVGTADGPAAMVQREATRGCWRSGSGSGGSAGAPSRPTVRSPPFHRPSARASALMTRLDPWSERPRARRRAATSR